MHDRNGTELKKGDVVALEGVVEELTGGEDYCNVSIRCTSNVRPNPTRFDLHTVNTNELYLVKRATTDGGENATQEGSEPESNQSEH